MEDEEREVAQNVLVSIYSFINSKNIIAQDLPKEHISDM